MENPKGFLGKDWNRMTKEEVLLAFFHIWQEKEDLRERLAKYEGNLMCFLKYGTKEMGVIKP